MRKLLAKTTDSLDKIFMYARIRALTLFGRDGYQPLPWQLRGPQKTQVLRMKNRLEAISEDLTALDKPSSILDLGCAEGYFTIHLAKLGHFVLGVDRARQPVLVGEGWKTWLGQEMTAFATMKIAPDSICALPDTDVTLCLSVYHQWVLSFGNSDAKGMLAKTWDKTKKVLYFETGTPREYPERYQIPTSEASNIEDESWIENLLAAIGAKNYRVIASLPRVDSVVENKRPLYAVLKPPA